jgi:hypothetical protein
LKSGPFNGPNAPIVSFRFLASRAIKSHLQRPWRGARNRQPRLDSMDQDRKSIRGMEGDMWVSDKRSFRADALSPS